MTSASARAEAKPAPEKQEFEFRHPADTDGAAVCRLIEACPPLDTNSMYCNLLQCSHFASTCVIAEVAGEVRGWVSGYRPPQEPGTLFIWQVAVHEAARGTGLGKKLLHWVWDRQAGEVDRMKTTITGDNEASWGLFRSFAKDRGALVNDQAWFERDTHFAGEHATEHLVTIGPVAQRD